MVDVIEAPIKAVTKKMSPKQKKMALGFLAVLATLSAGIAGLKDSWGVIEPAVTEFTGYARQEDLTKITVRLNEIQAEMPKRTYDCFKSKGLNCD